MYDERKILRDRSREQIDADLWGFSFDALFSLPVKMNPSYAHFCTFLGHKLLELYRFSFGQLPGKHKSD